MNMPLVLNAAHESFLESLGSITGLWQADAATDDPQGPARFYYDMTLYTGVGCG